MPNNYRHNWKNEDYKSLFKVCRENEGDANRVSELLKIFPNNAANGLRMMIEKYEHLNGNQEVRCWFKNTVSKRMVTAWQEWQEENEEFEIEIKKKPNVIILKSKKIKNTLILEEDEEEIIEIEIKIFKNITYKIKIIL